MDDTTPPDPQPTSPSDTAVAPTTTEAMPSAESVPPPIEVTPPAETPQAVPEAAPPENTPTPETPASPAPEQPPIADTPPPVAAAEPEPQPLVIAAPALTLEQMLARLSPTELKALFKKYLLDIGAKGRAKSKAQLKEKQDKIIAHIGVHGRITHKEVMQLTHSAKTTATRILQGLEKEGKVVQHGGYKARDAYYTLRL